MKYWVRQKSSLLEQILLQFSYDLLGISRRASTHNVIQTTTNGQNSTVSENFQNVYP